MRWSPRGATHTSQLSRLWRRLRVPTAAAPSAAPQMAAATEPQPHGRRRRRLACRRQLPSSIGGGHAPSNGGDAWGGAAWGSGAAWGGGGPPRDPGATSALGDARPLWVGSGAPRFRRRFWSRGRRDADARTPQETWAGSARGADATGGSRLEQVRGGEGGEHRKLSTSIGRCEGARGESRCDTWHSRLFWDDSPQCTSHDKLYLVNM